MLDFSLRYWIHRAIHSLLSCAIFSVFCYLLYMIFFGDMGLSGNRQLGLQLEKKEETLHRLELKVQDLEKDLKLLSVHDVNQDFIEEQAGIYLGRYPVGYKRLNVRDH